jgi:predicted acetyltransferase
MPELTPPAPGVQASFLPAMKEFQAEGRGTPDDTSMVGQEIAENSSTWDDPEAFAEYARELREQSLEDAPRPEGYVPCTTLWWVSGEEYLGRIAIRHRLTPWLREYGGHIGYDVRPSARRQGHATAMLAAILPLARELGIDPVLLTCEADNVGSRKTIEANHGVLEDQRGGKLRYWVPAS